MMNVALSAFLTLVIWIPMMTTFLNRGAFEYKSAVIRREAMKAGRVVTGTLVRKHHLQHMSGDKQGSSVNRANVRAKYQYVVSGRTYFWTGYTEACNIPEELTFYYPAGKPNKAVTDGQVVMGLRVKLLQAAPLLIFIGIYSIVNVCSALSPLG